MRIPSKRPPTRPGEILLEEFIKPLGISQVELAEWIGVSYPRLNEIVNGKRAITPDTALRLEQVFGVDAQFWLNLELAWELYQARNSKAANEIKRIRRHPGMATAAGV
jgi:addiction module HigA family antidote